MNSVGEAQVLPNSFFINVLRSYVLRYLEAKTFFLVSNRIKSTK